MKGPVLPAADRRATATARPAIMYSNVNLRGTKPYQPKIHTEIEKTCRGIWISRMAGRPADKYRPDASAIGGAEGARAGATLEICYRINQKPFPSSPTFDTLYPNGDNEEIMRLPPGSGTAPDISPRPRRDNGKRPPPLAGSEPGSGAGRPTLFSPHERHAGLRAWWAAITKAITAWRETHRMRRELREMSDRELAELGLQPSDVDILLKRCTPFARKERRG